MENNTFSYKYSAARNREVERIRSKYVPREENKLELLKRLDLRVRTAGTVEGLCLGIVGALIFGVGVCFMLGVLSAEPFITAFLMTLGTILMIPAYPLYKKIESETREKLAPEILRLSDEIINSEKNHS